MVAQLVQCGGEVVPVHPPAVGESAVGTERHQGVHRLARTIERHRILGDQVEGLGRGREVRHSARGAERLDRITPARRQHPRQVGPVERSEPPGVRLQGVADGIRCRKLAEVHVSVGGEDEGQPERRVYRRRPLEVCDRPAHVELDEPVQARDELLVGLEVGRLTGGRRPTAEARVEQRRQHGHDTLAQGFDRGERLSQRPGDRIECAQDLAVRRRRDLDLKPDAVRLAVVGAPDDRAGTGLPAQCPKPGGVEVARTVLSRRQGRCHHGHRGDDLDETGLREPLGHPVGRHVAEVVERRVAGVILDHGHDDPTLVEIRRPAPQHNGRADETDRQERRSGQDTAPAPPREDAPRLNAGAMGPSPERHREVPRRGGEHRIELPNLRRGPAQVSRQRVIQNARRQAGGAIADRGPVHRRHRDWRLAIVRDAEQSRREIESVPVEMTRRRRNNDHTEVVGASIVLRKYRPDWIMYPKYYKDSDEAKRVFALIDAEETARNTSASPLKRVSVRLDQLANRNLRDLSDHFDFELFSPHIEDM